MLQVRLTFDEPEPGITIVKLIHSDVPEEDRLVPSLTALEYIALPSASCIFPHCTTPSP